MRRNKKSCGKRVLWAQIGLISARCCNGGVWIAVRTLTQPGQFRGRDLTRKVIRATSSIALVEPTLLIQ